MVGAALAASTSSFRRLKLLVRFFFTFDIVVEHSGKKLLILLVKLLCEVQDTLPPGGRPSSHLGRTTSTGLDPIMIFSASPVNICYICGLWCHISPWGGGGSLLSILIYVSGL